VLTPRNRLDGPFERAAGSLSGSWWPNSSVEIFYFNRLQGSPKVRRADSHFVADRTVIETIGLAAFSHFEILVSGKKPVVDSTLSKCLKPPLSNHGLHLA
jgi:hypothetical protein